MKKQWSKYTLPEALIKLQELQLRIMRLQAAEKIKRANMYLKAQANNTDGELD